MVGGDAEHAMSAAAPPAAFSRARLTGVVLGTYFSPSRHTYYSLYPVTTLSTQFVLHDSATGTALPSTGGNKLCDT